MTTDLTFTVLAAPRTPSDKRYEQAFGDDKGNELEGSSRDGMRCLPSSSRFSARSAHPGLSEFGDLPPSSALILLHQWELVGTIGHSGEQLLCPPHLDATNDRHRALHLVLGRVPEGTCQPPIASPTSVPCRSPRNKRERRSRRQFQLQLPSELRRRRAGQGPWFVESSAIKTTHALDRGDATGSSGPMHRREAQRLRSSTHAAAQCGGWHRPSRLRSTLRLPP